MLASLAVGRSTITGLLEGDDVKHTASALRALGAAIERDREGRWQVDGVGVGGLTESDQVLDLGNSGTGARLLIGLTASHPFTSFFTGDELLCRRPMARVIGPLSHIGANFIAHTGHTLPLAVIGARSPIPIIEKLAIASAQVKSAILLAGLNAPGETTVIEPEQSRDHTEIMLRHFGARVIVEETSADGERGHAATVTGHPELTARDITVPGDPSSAAFPLVAAILAEDSEVTVTDVCVNPLRMGLYETLREMGADIVIANQREQGGEMVADITARSSRLKGVAVPFTRVPSMIDEFPILAVAAACAEGKTAMGGIAELRVKESDRVRAIVDGLARCGVGAEETEDGLVVYGKDGKPPGGKTIETHLDHRIAMAFLVMGVVSEDKVGVDNSTMIGTSFPGFAELMNRIGAKVQA